MQYLSSSIKNLLLAFFVTATTLSAQAQWVSIPDTNFGDWLNTNGFDMCLQGNSTVGWQMDTTCNKVVSAYTIDCSYSNLKSLEGIKYFDNLKELDCASNQLASLPSLPNSLTTLDFGSNEFVSFPVLSNSLITLRCADNQLTFLPALPDSLTLLNCGDCQLTSLPDLPNSLTYLDCRNNQLTSLPALPNNLLSLICFNNPSLSCLPKLGIVKHLIFNNTAITCLPNYPQQNINSNPPLDSITLCDVFNPNNCSSYQSILGTVFGEANQNCTVDVGESYVQSIKLLLQHKGSVVQQYISNNDGIYTFAANLDTFEIRIDTAGLPYTVTCPSSFYHTSILTLQDSMDTDKDFGLRCKPDFDLAIHSAVRDSGILFPAQKAGIRIKAGDISQIFGLNCVSGVSGKVVVIFSGPVSYAGVKSGSVVPNITGKTITYTIADFGGIDINAALGLIFLTDTFAQIGQELCLSITVIPDVAGDNNNTNNTLRICFPIVNSLDPNMKEVSPVNAIAPDEDWLTYTIHFQNMGNAPAIHIYVMDTLDNNLDESSIQILGSSHRMLTEIKGNIARFNFPNINLVDSATNEPESKGWLQYKIKKNTGLALGTQIKNTASIYFDFNAPVVTNTVTNTVEEPNAVKESREQMSEISVFPNPTNDVVYISYTSNTSADVTLFNINGAACLKQQLTASNQSISLSGLPAGVYFVSVEVGGNVVRKRVVKW